VAEVLRDLVPELVYVAPRWSSARAARRSRSCHHLVQRLPAMLTPRWVDTRSQPIAIRDVVHALATARDAAGTAGEVQLGGATS
jgi:hypothetical protein